MRIPALRKDLTSLFKMRRAMRRSPDRALIFTGSNVMFVYDDPVGRSPRRPVHTYNNGQPYQIARGRNSNRDPVEYSRPTGHSILHGRPSIEQFIVAVKRELKIRKYSPNSINNYISAIKAFLGWLGHPPNRATIEDVREWLELMVDGGASASHLAVTLSAIRTAFDKFCCRDITLGLATPRRKKRQPVVLSTAEVTRILNAAPNQTIKLAIGIMYAAGLRNSELCKLQAQDIDFDRNAIRIRQGKGNADRIVMLPATFTPILKRKCADLHSHEFIFPSLNHRSDRHVSPRTLQRWVTTAAELAGISKRVTPHSFRHAFATHLLENGTDIRFIQKLLGHQRLETTTIYTRVAQLKTQNVTSPLDRLTQQSHEVAAQTPPASHPNVTPKPVGRLSICISNGGKPDAADVRINIAHAHVPQQVVLDGIHVRLDDRKWIQLDIPTPETWLPQLQRLPPEQRERIESPEFFELLRSQISKRFLNFIASQPRGPD